MALSTTSESRAFGIPTTYHGTRFRSRLEARWAAFFDMIEWSWVYEPFDLEGWIPDFLIQGHRPLVIEVGPCAVPLDYQKKAAKGFRALLNAGSNLDFLTLGISPITEFDNATDLLTAGLLDEGYWRLPPVDATGVVETGEFGPLDPVDAGWAVWGRCLDIECGRIIVSHETGSYDSRPCGYADHSGGLPHPINVTTLGDLWATAGNRVQWRSR